MCNACGIKASRIRIRRGRVAKAWRRQVQQLVVERKGVNDAASEASTFVRGERWNRWIGPSALKWAHVGEDKMSIRSILN